MLALARGLLVGLVNGEFNQRVGRAKNGRRRDGAEIFQICHRFFLVDEVRSSIIAQSALGQTTATCERRTDFPIAQKLMPRGL